MLYVGGMRRMLAVAITVIVSRAPVARAVEARTELTVGGEFVFLTNDLEVEFLDGQLALGGGITMVSDYAIERYGAQALVEYRGDHASAGLAATFGPRQQGRGWAALDPHVELQRVSGRWQWRGDGGVLLRRIDAEARRRLLAIDQLQLHAAADVTVDDRWRIGVLALYSFYDPSPSRNGLRNLDLGLAVTLAGRPEQWALGATLARRLPRSVWCQLGAAGVTYADGRGTAVVPHAMVELGAWRGVSVDVSLDFVVAASGAPRDPLRAIAGLALEYAR